MKKRQKESPRNNLMKTCVFIFSLCISQLAFWQTKAQERVYDNFEGVKALHYGERSGVLDTLAKNPAPGEKNNSQKCGLYVRNASKKFANIKMNLNDKLKNVSAYATYEGVPPKIKMKVFTAAPPGTLIEILLGSRNRNNDYPAGTHSQYQAYTKKSNTWEELEFIFSQVPQGSETSAEQIDQLVLLFNPNSASSDTYYFDDLTGPELMSDDKSQSAMPEKKSREKAAKAQKINGETGNK